MPGNTPRSELERIYRLIQAEKLDEAVDALRPIVKEDGDNEDAWWLLANAATDPTEAKHALENVLRLNPANTQASGLIEQLHSAYPELKPATTPTGDLDWSPQDFEDVLHPAGTETAKPDDLFGEDREPDFAAQGELAKANYPQPEFFPEKFGDVPLHEPAGGAAAKSTPSEARAPGAATTPAAAPTARDAGAAPEAAPSRWHPTLMGVMLLLVIVLGAFYVLSNQGGAPAAPTTTPGATSVAAVPTAGATVAATVAAAATNPESTAAGAQTAQATTPTLAPAVTGESGTSAPATSAATSAAGVGPATQGPTEPAPATAGASAPTAAVTEAVVIPSPSAPLALSLGGIAEPFKSAGLADAAATIEDSILGQTLTIKFCSKLGADLLRNTDSARDQLAGLAAPYASEIAAIGVRITNCAATGNVLYNKVVPIAVVKAFAEKKVDTRKFRASWINP